MKWRKGRELQSVTDSAGQVVAFSYNGNGVRTAKNDCGVVHSYLVDGTKILRESYSDKTLDYLYDNEDSVCGLILNGTAYYFYKNLQGDVIAITDKDGVVKARYSYDAWGACTVESDTSGTNIASINPFRYRSYYFDVETGFYYLQSRYYDPIVGRFINADDVTVIEFGQNNIIEFNIYAYCGNDSVNNTDPNGKWLLRLVCGVAGAAIFGTIANVFCRILDVDSTTRRWITVGFAALGGVLGAVFGPALLAKIAPKALDWINSIEKAMKKKFNVFTSDKRCIIGVEINSRFKLMLHWPHEGKGIHIAIEHKTAFGRWRKTIDDIELKKIGSRFMNWIKK